jgi:hypothetical protein
MPPPKALEDVAAAVGAKVDAWIRNGQQFRHAVEQAFFAADAEGRGRVTVDQAAAAGRKFFRDVSARALDAAGMGVRMVEPSRAEIRRLLEEAGYGGVGGNHPTLTREQFEEFYLALVKWSAIRYAAGFARKYALGVAAATVGAVVLKKMLCAVPVVGVVPRFVPALVAGPVLGVTAVWAAEQGDLEAVQRQLFRTAKGARDAVAARLPGSGGAGKGGGGGFKVG